MEDCKESEPRCRVGASSWMNRGAECKSQGKLYERFLDFYLSRTNPTRNSYCDTDHESPADHRPVMLKMSMKLIIVNDIAH